MTHLLGLITGVPANFSLGNVVRILPSYLTTFLSGTGFRELRILLLDGRPKASPVAVNVGYRISPVDVVPGSTRI